MYTPSKHARSILHPIQSAHKYWLEVCLMIFCTLDKLLPEEVCLAKTWQLARAKSDPGWFCTVCTWVWRWETETGCGPVAFSRKLAKSFLHIGLLLGQLHSPGNWPNHSCTLACFWARCFLSEPDHAIQIIPGPVFLSTIRPSLEEQTESDVGSRSHRYNPAWFWLHTGHNGHN